MLVQTEPQRYLQAGASSMAGTSQSDYALKKPFKSACASTSCSWNKSAKCDIEPKN